MVLRRMLLGLACLVAVAGEARAQAAVELTPFVGYRFFGSLTDYTGAKVETDDAVSYGGFATIRINPDYQVDVGYSRQETQVVLSAPFLGADRYDVYVEHWSIGGHRMFGPRASRVRGFGNGFLGLTQMAARSSDDSTTKFMLGAGIGAKAMMPSNRLGIRVEARGYFTLAGGGGASIACGFNGCGLGFGSQTFFQMDLLAGVVLGLGLGYD